MSKETNCFDCKYISYEMYAKNKCKSPELVTIDHTRLVTFIHPMCADINTDLNCKFFKYSKRFRILKMISNIRVWYMKKLHPEWFI
jgi:hypothetical protein